MTPAKANRVTAVRGIYRTDRTHRTSPLVIVGSIGQLLFIAVTVLLVSCSRSGAVDSKENANAERSAEQRHEPEIEGAPEKGEIAEDCVGFVRLTKSAVRNPTSECPTCPSGVETAEVLRVKDIKVEELTCEHEGCEAVVSLTVVFNPSTGQAITGGLVGWISEEHRAEWLKGVTPSGPQVYKVKISYRREGISWRAVEFARASS